MLSTPAIVSVMEKLVWRNWHTLSEIFGVEIKNCYNVYMNMKRRKDDSRTYFLDELREKLNKRMVESDLKGASSKSDNRHQKVNQASLLFEGGLIFFIKEW